MNKASTFKDFVKLKKNMINKCPVLNQIQILLNTHIQNQEAQQFADQLNKHQSQAILSYIFSQNQLKQTPLMKILQFSQKQAVLNFLNSISKWSALKYKQIYQNLIVKIKDNQLFKNDVFNKFNDFNKTLINKLLTEKNSQFQQTIVEILSIENSIFYLFYRQFLSLDLVKRNLKNGKHDKQDLQYLLNRFYIPLSKRTEQTKQETIKKTSHQLQEYRTQLFKQKSWNCKDYLSLIKNRYLNQQILELEELNFSFLHQIILEHQWQKFVQIYNFFQSQQKEDNDIIMQKLFNEFDQLQDTPSDICLKTWKYQQIITFLDFIINKKHIYLSVNFLIKILTNQHLSQQSKQTIIIKILQSSLMEKGFIQLKKSLKNIQFKNSKDSIRKGLVKQNLKQFSLVYNFKDLLTLRQKHNSFPFLIYLDMYKQKCNVSILEQLYINILDHQSIQQKIKFLMKYEIQKIQIKAKSQEFLMAEELIYYYQPLLTLLSRLQQGEISKYLLEKININYYQIVLNQLKVEENIKYNLIIKNRHFLVNYINNHKNLSQNQQNKFILDCIFSNQNNQKSFQFYVNLLKNLNKSNSFQKNDTWMIKQIRSTLLKQFQNIQQSQLMSPIYQSSVFISLLIQQLSPFYLKNNKLKKNYAKSQNYSYVEFQDWSLYNMRQLIQRFGTEFCKNIIFQNSSEGNEIAGCKDSSEVLKRTSVASLILNFQKQFFKAAVQQKEDHKVLINSLKYQNEKKEQNA